MGKRSKKVVYSKLDETPEQRKERVNALNNYNRTRKIGEKQRIADMLDPENKQSILEIEEATFNSLYNYATDHILKNEISENPKPFDEVLKELHTRLLPLKKAADIRRIRMRRKQLGDYGVKRFKASIQRSYDRLLTYLWRDLYNEVVLQGKVKPPINNEHERETKDEIKNQEAQSSSGDTV